MSLFYLIILPDPFDLWCVFYDVVLFLQESERQIAASQHKFMLAWFHSEMFSFPNGGEKFTNEISSFD